MDWIDLALDRDKWQALGRTLLHGVSQCIFLHEWWWTHKDSQFSPQMVVVLLRM